jgi:hypothetical protein
MTDDAQDGFDYSPLGQSWWIQTARELGASDKQTKFAASKHRGCSNTRAAEESGYTATTEAGLRTTGYRLFRSNIVQRLLAMTVAEGGGPDGTVDAAEARRILSSLARGSDPSIRIRSVEALAKLDEADRQARRTKEDPSPKEIARTILTEFSTLGPAIIADCQFTNHNTLWGLPFLKELAPLLKRDYPAAWQKYRAAMLTDGDRFEFDAISNGPILSIQQIVGPIKTKPTNETSAEE